MKILFTGGGTGGHIFPIIAIAREIRRIKFSILDQAKEKKEALALSYIGPGDPFGEILLTQEEIKTKSILAGKIRRYFTPLSLIQNFFDIFFKTPIGILQAFFHIFFLAPDLILSKGGYGSLPAVLAGWILGIPIFLHESDVAPGFSNRILSRFAALIFVSFPKTEYFPLPKIVLVGNPIRREILKGSEEEAKKIFNLKRDKPLILILGGSQGAQRINDLILAIFPQLLENFEIIHQCGEKNFKEVRAEANVVMNAEQQKSYHLYPFLREKELSCAYKACDLIVCRAGSSSIFEIAAIEKPSILIPLPEAAQNHQLKNAQNYGQQGAALIIEETNLTPHFFLDRLEYLFSHPEELEKMKKVAIRFSQPEAARIIAQDIIGYLSD
jgi:UDP-N-acetylglucosamine--N-acetylmuramyl-(pentapeptide) pyrophosphoryl-undecaprenol N-acetylglucosamine transferase